MEREGIACVLVDAKGCRGEAGDDAPEFEPACGGTKPGLAVDIVLGLLAIMTAVGRGMSSLRAFSCPGPPDVGCF